MTVEVDEWRGMVPGRTDPTDAPVIALPIERSRSGGAGTFLAADANGARWWVKPLNNFQGARITVTEAVVGAVGRLIGAPVCTTAIVRLPDEIAGWEFRTGRVVEPGYAHGSAAVSGAREARSLRDLDRDENAKRRAGLAALYDWCWGGDDQWLYSEPEDRRLYSHDHGWYLPETGPTWSEASLMARVDQPHLPAWPTAGLDVGELATLAGALRGLSRTAVAQALAMIPRSWPVSDRELEVLGWFLERRAVDVAGRMEVMLSAARGGAR